MRSFHRTARENNKTLFDDCLAENKTQSSILTKVNEFENVTGYTPLQIAVCYGHFGVAVQLLIAGAEPTLRIGGLDYQVTLREMMASRQCGKLFHDLINFATGNLQGDENPAVFHVLFYHTLLAGNNEKALSYLNPIISSTHDDLKAKIKASLLIPYLFFYDNKSKLSKVLESFLDTNYQTALMTHCQKSKDDRHNPSKIFEDADYIAIASRETFTTLDAYPINSTTLPWLMHKDSTKIHDRVTHLIELQNADELKSFEKSGYNLKHHFYRLIAFKGNDHAIKVLAEKYRFDFIELFLLATADSQAINLEIFQHLSNAIASKDKTLTRTDIITQLETELQNLGSLTSASKTQISKQFSLIKETQVEQKRSQSTSQLQSLPTVLVSTISRYLDFRSVTELAGTCKTFQLKFMTNNLSHSYMEMQFLRGLDEKERTIDHLIQQLYPIRGISYLTWLCDDERSDYSACYATGLFGCCIPATIMFICGVSSIGGSIPPAAYIASTASTVGSAGTSIGTHQIQKHCGYLSGRKFETLSVEATALVQQALPLIPTDAKPQNTKDLVLALQEAKRALVSTKEMLLKTSQPPIQNREQKPTTSIVELRSISRADANSEERGSYQLLSNNEDALFSAGAASESKRSITKKASDAQMPSGLSLQ